MNKSKNQIQQNKQKSFTTSVTLLTTMILLTLQIGCASNASKDNSTEAVLKKESALIEKIKLERAQASIAAAVEQNVILKTSEAHLLEGLNALKESNNVLQMRFENQSRKEFRNEFVGIHRY